MSLLRIENLFKTFNTKNGYILENINLTVEDRECFCLLGASGSGKTTLGKCILKIIPFDKGNILFKGRDIYSIRDYAKYVSYVPQDPMASINPFFKAIDVVLEPLKIMSLVFDKKEILKAIYKAGLKEEILDKRVKNLSGGERQRLAIARAIITKPSLIVADEPTSSVDAVNKNSLASLFLDFKSNIGIFIITHDVKFAKKICDKIGIMYEGKIVEIGDKDRVFNNPVHPFTKKLINVFDLDCDKASFYA